MSVIKTVSIVNKFGKPVAEVAERVSRDSLRGTITKSRTFKPRGDHFLKRDNIHIYHTKDLKTGKTNILAYMGEAMDGQCLAVGIDNVKKLVKSVKEGIQVNLYSKDWYKQVFGK